MGAINKVMYEGRANVNGVVHVLDESFEQTGDSYYCQACKCYVVQGLRRLIFSNIQETRIHLCKNHMLTKEHVYNYTLWLLANER